MYMATLTATRCPGPIRAFYQWLCVAGKAKKVALPLGEGGWIPAHVAVTVLQRFPLGH